MKTRLGLAALFLLSAPVLGGDKDQEPLSFRRAPGSLCLRISERVRRLERRISSDDPTRKRLRLWRADYVDLPPLSGTRKRQRRYHLARILDHAAAEHSFDADSQAADPIGLEDARIDVSEVPQHSNSFDALPENQRRARAVDGLIEALLPRGDTKLKARWKIDAEQALSFFIPGGERFRGRASAVFERMIRENGRRRARIRIQIRGRLRVPGRFERAEAAVKLSGKLHWDLAGFPARLELSGPIERRISGQYVNIDSKGKAYYGTRYTRRRREAVELNYRAEVVDAAAALSDDGRLPPSGNDKPVGDPGKKRVPPKRPALGGLSKGQPG